MVNDKPTIFIRTLGCPKNEVDSLFIANQLTKKGYNVTSKLTNAEVVILNTCGFLEEARMESVEELNFLLGLKQIGLIKKVIITGCYAQRSPYYFSEQFRKVDGVIGNRNLKLIPDFVTRVLQSDDSIIETPIQYGSWYGNDVYKPSTYPFAYLKIAEGCSNYCSYCLLPELRGKYRSIPRELLLKQAKGLLDMGFKELVISAQDTGRYGEDIYGKPSLNDLLKDFLGIKKDYWLRILYMHPRNLDPNLITLFRDDPRLVPYLDLPIQHVSDNILKRMNRKIGEDEQKKLIATLKEKCPSLALRTTIMVGFPGETDRDFEKVVDFVEEGWFDHIGIFKYSKEEGTPAYNLEGEIPERVKDMRRDVLALTAEEIAQNKARKLLGKKYRVLVETEERQSIESRLPYDAPQIDRVVVLREKAPIGEFTEVKLIGFKDFTFFAVKEESDSDERSSNPPPVQSTS